MLETGLDTAILDPLDRGLRQAPLAAGAVLGLDRYKLYRWPGHGVSTTSSYQCLEAEYMHADEYDQFIADPTNYFMRTYLPRIFGALEPWGTLPPRQALPVPAGQSRREAAGQEALPLQAA